MSLEQRGVDVVVELLGKDNVPIASFDDEIRSIGEEKVELVAEAPGSYRLVVKAKYPKLPAGRYDIRLVEVRNATDGDRLMREARGLQAESEQLTDAGRYAEALPPAEKALELRERVLGANHPELYDPLLNLAIINFRNREYAKAKTLGLRALAITETARGPEHPQVARLLYSLAVFYSWSGDDLRAEPLLQRALPIQESALGPGHPHVAHTLNLLAVIARSRGDFVRAESLFQRALLIAEKALGEEHDDVGYAANTLAGMYREMGDYVRAEPLYLRALGIYEKRRGTDHPYLAGPLHNLANLYRDTGEFDKAERFYKRAIAIREKGSELNHPDLAGSLAGLALVYYMRGDYALAESLYPKAVASLEKALGPDHPLVAWHLGNMAKLYCALDEVARAEPLYRRALAIFENAYGTNCYYLAGILVDLARLSAAKGLRKQAIAFQTRANTIIEHNLHLNLGAGSERQKLAYLATLPEQMNQAISLHVHLAPDDREARVLAATSVLQRKGRVQDALSDNLASMRARFSAEDRTLLDQLNSVTSRLARLVLNAPQGTSAAESQNQIMDLEARRERLESEINRRSAGSYQKAQPISLVAVQRAIPNDAALIEFVVYRPLDPKAATDTHAVYGRPRYVAYVLRRNADVQWCDLGDAQAIDQAVERLREALRDPSRSDARELARSLDQQIMRPTRALAGQAARLLVSPDGALNLIPFEALVDEQGRYLIQRYSFAYLTSGRDLLRFGAVRESRSQPVVLADPAFGEPATSAASANVERAREEKVRIDQSQVFFGPLPGAAAEVRALRELLPQATFLTKERATKSALMKVHGPSILHIATHGFFLQNDPRVRDWPRTGTEDAKRLGKFAANVQNPLLRSGLALAGANQRGSGTDDGVLTALEAAQLDLWGTKLVVLSACDTGIGEVKSGEGVYGLRRALVLAGAESQVMSLWPVSDRSTRDLMIGYYRGLSQNEGRGDALRRVQLRMLRDKAHSHPYYWASFILAGEWANLKGERSMH